MAGSMTTASSLRIDKLLWFLRLTATRALAQDWAGTGHIRLNGRRIERASAAVRAGDVLVLALHGKVRVIEIVVIPTRRGPAPEAQGCYRFVDASGAADSGDARNDRAADSADCGQHYGQRVDGRPLTPLATVPSATPSITEGQSPP
jgi:ribosome-associated heat shock protein Hsp15